MQSERDRWLERIQKQVDESFQKSEHVQSFAEYLDHLTERPRLHLRTAAQYVVDMIDSFGFGEAHRVGQEAVRYRVFDSDASAEALSLSGQERVQEELYGYLLAAARRGKSEKMFLLHGPNGSGKTTVVECLVRGLEAYSHTDDGVLLRFNWVFPEGESRLERIGFESDPETASDLETFAYLGEKDVSAKLECELRDSPLYLLPKPVRQEIVEAAVANAAPEQRPNFPYDLFLDGELCQKCRRIYDALLVAYHGDWRRVVRHVQVERFFVSKRYRVGAVSIEPQGNVDAGARHVQHDSSWSLPNVLRNLTLYEPVGDIVDANRGILEYSDFLKRPLETNKYLLTTCERGTVSLANCMAYLDLVIVGTSNEKQLNLFKQSADFSSFKGRMELIPVPYLLRYSVEAALYAKQIDLYAGERHVTPHTASVAALWAVLTRLRRPDPDAYSGRLKGVVASLAPLEKALLYDRGETPSRLSEEDRKALRAGVIEIRREFEGAEAEFEGIPGLEYEGRRGASPREMMTVLARAAESGRRSCLTPMAVFSALEELIRESGVYDYLRIAPDEGYHDPAAFLESVRGLYLQWVTDEVYESIELVDEEEYDRVFFDYFRHVKAFHTGEKVQNPATGAAVEPNEELMASIESLLTLDDGEEKFRSTVMTRIAAWSLDHPEDTLDYHALFPEIATAMREKFYRERNRLLTLIEEDILKYGTEEFDSLSDAEKEQVDRALRNMREKYHYCEECAREVIAYVLGVAAKQPATESDVRETA